MLKKEKSSFWTFKVTAQFVIVDDSYDNPSDPDDDAT